MNKSSAKRLKVLYIGAMGRSGTTLIDTCLNSVDGCIALGELHTFWDVIHFKPDRLCSNGQKVLDIPFWQEVIYQTVSERTNPILDDLSKSRKKLSSYWYLPQVLFPALRIPTIKAEIEIFKQHLHDLYMAIHRISGEKIIIDSSKSLLYALLLNEIPEIDVYFLHVVRDSRAVAYSWTKDYAFFKVRHPIQSAMRWNLVNSSTIMLKNCFPNYTLMTYEDFAMSPKASIESILKFVDHDADTDFVQGNQITTKPSLAFAGNPKRLDNSDTINIQLDDKWRSQLPKYSQYLVTTATAPLLYYFRKQPKLQDKLSFSSL